MNIWLRRTYFISTIVLFLVLAPTLLFYAAGWRFNFQTKALEKVGAITLETEPKGASVFLNGKLLPKKTPLELNNLLPGQYHLSLTKEGYYDWGKNIQIESGEVVRIMPLYLLKKQSNLEPLSKTQFEIIKQSPDKKKIAGFQNNLIEIINLKNFEVILKITEKNQVKNFLWSANSEKIIAELDNNNFLLLDLTTPETATTLLDLFDLACTKVWWSQEENDVIYASTDKKLYRLNIFQNTKTFLIEGGDIIYVANHLFFRQKDKRLEILDDQGVIKNNIDLIEDSDLKFFPPFDSLLPFLDKTYQKLFFYDIDNNTFDQLNEKVKNIFTSSDRNKIFFFNNHEIWVWHRNEARKELIVRTSEKITAALWLENEQYAIYAPENNRLKAIEIQGPQRNTYELPLNNVSQLLSGQNNKTIHPLVDGSLYQLIF